MSQIGSSTSVSASNGKLANSYNTVQFSAGRSQNHVSKHTAQEQAQIQAQAQIDVLNTIIQEDTAKMTQKQEYISYLEQQISVLKKENIMLQRPVVKQNAKLQVDFLEKQVHSIEQIDQLRRELDDYQAELRKKDLELARLKQENESQAAIIKSAERGLVQHSETIRQQSVYFDEQNVRNTRNFEVEMSEIQNVYQQIRNERDQLKKSFVDVARDNLTLKSQLTQAEAQLRDSQATNKQLEASMNQLKHSKKALSRELHDLQYLNSQISVGSEMAMMFDSNEQVAQMRSKMAQLEQDLLSSQTVESGLRAQLDENKASHEYEISSLRSQLEATQSQAKFDIIQQQETVQNLTELLAKTQRELEVIKSRNTDTWPREDGDGSDQALKEQLREVQEELEQISQGFQAKDAEIHRLQSLNESLSLRLTDTAPVAEQLHTLDGDMGIEELQMSMLDLQAENKKLKDELELIKSRACAQFDE